jgi:hypothetical protein
MAITHHSMMAGLRKLGLALLLIAAALAQPVAAASEPQDVLQSFYGVLLEDSSGGVVAYPRSVRRCE